MDRPRKRKYDRSRGELSRKATMRRILDAILENGPAARIDISRATGINAPTVSKLMDMLHAAGHVEIHRKHLATKGRPSIIYRVTSADARVIGVVVDVNRCAIAPAGFDGTISGTSHIVFDTPATYDALMGRLVSEIRKLTANSKDTRWLGIGLSLPGLINGRTGEIEFSPNLHSTDGHFPARDLQKALAIQTVAVQEERGLCFAERMYGPDRHIDNFAMVDIEAGLGMGVYSNGGFLAGHSGFAGEIGHITVQPEGRKCGCGNHGCLETCASETAFAAAVSARLHRKLNTDQIIDMVGSGKLTVDSELAEVWKYMAIGLATVINILNPGSIFIRSRLFDLQPDSFEHLEKLVRARALKPAVTGCNLLRARSSKIQGAVAVILDHLYSAIGPARRR